jgi:hypothetical protein
MPALVVARKRRPCPGGPESERFWRAVQRPTRERFTRDEPSPPSLDPRQIREPGAARWVAHGEVVQRDNKFPGEDHDDSAGFVARPICLAAHKRCFAWPQRMPRPPLTTWTSSINPPEIDRQDRHAMHRDFIFIASAVLLAYAPMDNALANPGSGGQSRTVHSSQRHAISPRHHAPVSDNSNENYRSQLKQAKSEWRQALHHGYSSAPVQTATP